MGSPIVQCNFFEYNLCLDSKLSGFLIILRNVNMLPFTNKQTHKWVLAIEMASNSNLKSSFPVLSPTYPDQNKGVLTK